MSECEAVLRTANILAMKYDVMSYCFSYFKVAKTRAVIERITNLSVFDFDASWTPKTKVEDIKKKIININDCMKDTKTLIKRLLVEFNKYFPNPDSDQLLMMIFHPIMVRHGFR